MMWNPFRRYTSKPTIVGDASPPELIKDPTIAKQIESARLRSMAERTKITMIHDRLAAEAVCTLRGGKRNAPGH